MSTFLRQSVVFTEMHPKIKEARRRLEILYNSLSKDLLITSARDGQHSIGSLHPDGKALDFRRLGVARRLVVAALKPIGIKSKDIIHNKTYDIYHIEWDDIIRS